MRRTGKTRLVYDKKRRTIVPGPMRRTAQQRKEAGQDAIISAIAAAAFKADDTGDGELGDAIRREGARLAKRFGIAQVPGLPGTYYQGCDLSGAAASRKSE